MKTLKSVKTAIVLIASAFLVNPAFAYNAHENVSITHIVHWGDQDNLAPVYFGLSDGAVCYVPVEEKRMFALVLSVYLARERVDVHCNETLESVGGAQAHKVHRLVVRP